MTIQQQNKMESARPVVGGFSSFTLWIDGKEDLTVEAVMEPQPEAAGDAVDADSESHSTTVLIEGDEEAFPCEETAGATDLNTIAVIGAGSMGRGIVETAAVRGLTVHSVEVSDEQRRSARERIEASISKAIQRGKVDLKSPDEALGRIQWHADLEPALAEAEFVIEAVPEHEELKAEIFRRLDSLCRPEVILASNTSSISITRLAAVTNRPDKVVGMHFFNPVPIMQPVEIVRGLATSDETIERTRVLAERLGKQPFTVADTPGFAVNRVLMPLINEAVFALQEGVAEAGTIDSLMKLGCNHPMGPLELADFIGLDVCLSILRVLHRELGDPKFRPCPLLVRMVDAGRLGRKSGRGFYNY